MKTCTKCGDEYPPTTQYFYSDSSKPDGLTYSCRICQRKADAIRRAEGRKRNVKRTLQNIKRAAGYMLRHKNKRKSQLAALKLDIGCQLCDYRICSRALEFHHKSDKDYNVSQMAGRSVETIRSELCKCIVVCANCHAETHDGLHDVADLSPISMETASLFVK